MSGFRPFWFLCLLAPAMAFAGGNAFRTLVVVNTNSAASVELGAYYAEQHGIPDHQICSVGIATNLVSLSAVQFRNGLRNPIYDHLAAEGLEGQIDFVVLCQDFPTRINNVEGIPAALFYGYQNAPGYNEGGIGCNLPDYTSNLYYRAERAFRSTDGWNGTNGFVAFHLVASNLPTAKLVADRGAAAQSSFPNAAVYLYTLGSAGRSVREQLYANAQFAFTALPDLPLTCTIAPYLWVLSGKTNVVGYQDGYGNIPALARTNNAWVAGAYADHLTSLGGCLPTNYLFQSTVLDWMDIGAAASYGTVAEPCNYLEKFPDPLMAFWYARGFTVGEAYAMAVAAPYQGLFAGDPLAAPFAAPPVVSNLSHAPYQIVTGTVPVQVAAVARTNGAPAARIDFYLDGRFQTNLAALAPTPGNVLAVAVAGHTNSAAVATNQTLADAVAALADEINGDTNAIVRARAFGDRLELAYENFDRAGDHAPVAAFAATGTASVLTLGVGRAGTNLYPSAYPARKNFVLWALTNGAYSTIANAGDTVALTITLTNGVAVTNVLVASAGERITNLFERLRVAISTNTVLMATNGVRFDYIANGLGNVLNDATLFARRPGPEGAGILIDCVATPVATNYGLITNFNFSAFMQDWPDDLRARASVLFHVAPTAGVLAATAELDTTALDDGLHVLDFIVQDGSAVAAAARHSLPLYVGNSSPQLALLGTNGAEVADGAAPAAAAGTDFGAGPWSQPRTNVFGLRNAGPVPLAISGWTTNGSGAAAFQVSGVPANIAAGGVSNFIVVFTPPAAGDYEAGLAFASDALVPQTNLLLAGAGRFELAVATAHGDAVPPVGNHLYAPGAVLTNSVAAPAPAGGTQFVCNGWALAGHEPSGGGGTNFVLTVTNDAALAWLWTTNFWLDTEAGEHGAVAVADAWQPAGVSTQIAALPDDYYGFAAWSGDDVSTNNPLDLLMDAPKAVQANFAALLATNDVPQWWLAQFGWTNDFDAAALDDFEPDGFPAWQEYVADTDPTDDGSYPRMAFVATWQTNAPVLTWPFSTGRLYAIQWCDDIVAGEWSGQLLGLGIGEWTDTNAPPATGRWYRVAPQVP